MTTVVYIWRHDICHVTASRWCHICQNVSPILSNRYDEAISAVGIIKKVTGEKRQGGGTPPPPPPGVRGLIFHTSPHQQQEACINPHCAFCLSRHIHLTIIYALSLPNFSDHQPSLPRLQFHISKHSGHKHSRSSNVIVRHTFWAPLNPVSEALHAVELTLFLWHTPEGVAEHSFLSHSSSSRFHYTPTRSSCVTQIAKLGHTLHLHTWL